MNKNLNKEKKASQQAVILSELENNYKMATEVSAEGSTPIYFLVSIRITADSLELLNERCKDVDAIASQLNIDSEKECIDPWKCLIYLPHSALIKYQNTIN